MKSDYERIARAIDYIQKNVDQQPGLKAVARHTGLSPYHFQRLFRRWAGVTPKRFLEYLTVEKAKILLQHSTSVMDTSLEMGLSGPGRLHDQFVSIEGISPGEFKSQGANLKIDYGFHHSPFGEVLVALTARGILALSFTDKVNREIELGKLKSVWSNAIFTEEGKRSGDIINSLFGDKMHEAEKFLLSVRGTNFQIRVWNALLSIPSGSVVSYQAIARKIKHPGAVRAVANAVGANPVAYLIPCHRVLRSSGELGGYRWGVDRKRIMLGREWVQA